MKFINEKRQKRYEQMKKEQESIPEIYFFTGEDATNFKKQVSEAIEKNPTLSPEEFYRMKINYQTFKEAQKPLKRPRSKRLESRSRRFIIDAYIKFYSILYKLKLYKHKN